MTALAVQKLHGAEILKTPAPGGMHFYNRMGGVRHYFTAAQFAEPLQYEDLASSSSEAEADTSPQQVEALLRAIRVGAATPG
ncbi:MAG: hypothetical protein AVDCRST_MAG62-700 [uncultured Sphingomonas sp.]|uniref:Uncharacterized protein n=1 Tax=uncultured Sphingomonas sp. TaxID=158754 RepID=A0A6J4T5U4_9SPHN|nr:MAG: hypothetical protein AVDCRST_MAG62-700 [uncultured Sphingomonas sp.]